MSGNTTFGAKTVCPYYLRETGQAVCCEGHVEGCCIVIRFDSPKRKLAYQRAVCARHGYEKRCPIAAAAEKKWI